MGSIYAWATPVYLLDSMTLAEIYMYHDYGVEFETDKANILVYRLGVGLFGAKEIKKKSENHDSTSTPDKAEFYKRYGDKIKRPGGEEIE